MAIVTDAMTDAGDAATANKVASRGTYFSQKSNIHECWLTCTVHLSLFYLCMLAVDQRRSILNNIRLIIFGCFLDAMPLLEFIQQFLLTFSKIDQGVTCAALPKFLNEIFVFRYL